MPQSRTTLPSTSERAAEAGRAERAAVLADLPPPPAIRRSRVKLLVLATAGLLMAALLVAVVINLDRASAEDDRPAALDGVIPLIPPPLRDDLEASALRDMDDVTNIGAEDAGIDVVDPQTGRLAQRYRFARLEPSPAGRPAGWLGLTRPGSGGDITLGES